MTEAPIALGEYDKARSILRQAASAANTSMESDRLEDRRIAERTLKRIESLGAKLETK